jgi:hypothetical protein
MPRFYIVFHFVEVHIRQQGAVMLFENISDRFTYQGRLLLDGVDYLFLELILPIPFILQQPLLKELFLGFSQLRHSFRECFLFNLATS